ncbi:pEARLI1-like lipid transfer protein 1 [Lactuca sativa]|uniref:Bifunctional inhibitor/plant lipid transfer protein/seed storage helical domain-containing protein n=1 Tax=Lactuca sativa TaxID=4236 RepID=A0A9R1UY96_LACSA|nr:pEARLI1-like lipid transfer protein 1 [Lactuca sativa]KAJ0195494.1 hypothetical protein LSAT_V11C700361650 [Lactuca sativa]
MASTVLVITTFLLTFNLVFFTLASSTNTAKGCPPPPKPSTPSKPQTPTKPPKPSTPSTPPKATCPRDTLKLGVCANLLNNLLPIVVGNRSETPCCSLIAGLTDLDAAVCLCTAIKADVLGINLNVPVSLSVLLNYCEKKAPSGFQCT